MSRSRPLLWCILAIPAATVGLRWIATPDAYGYGHALSELGRWAAWLLLATLAVTPIRLAFRGQRWANAMAQRRRDLGLASFAYAAAHTAVYLVDAASARVILAAMPAPENLTGWIALALFVPLAVTSNDAAMRRLKRGWKRLHRLVYPAAIVTFAHWALSAFDPTTAYLTLGVFLAIEVTRLVLQRRQRVT